MFLHVTEAKYVRDYVVDPELGTIVWDNGADLASEFLYENMRVLA